MRLYRKTAIVQFELFSGATEGSLPLATEREFGVILSIEGVTYPARNFQSPINDEQWRDFDRRLRDCNVNHNATGYRGAAAIRSLAQQLYQSLVAINSVLRDFLGQAGTPRRLVIQTTRPELHLLPWAALIDDAGAFLAAGDLSVVQTCENFSLAEITTGNSLRLMKVLGADTNLVTSAALDGLPPEIDVRDGSRAFQDNSTVEGIDILHLEEHGNAVSTSIGDVYATSLAQIFSDVKIALLWSCFSGAANSWGESPALCLHRKGAGLVLSFLAELHNLDAKSIATRFYLDVFGPAASRDPETALVRIRADKFASEFQYANWASMTVYMRAPLDLSALPLNGPRVPQAGWSDNAITTSVPNGAPLAAIESQTEVPESCITDACSTVTPTVGADPALTALWTSLTAAVNQLQPGTLNEFEGFSDLPKETTATLPRAAFKAWRGNVIRIDGSEEPLAKITLDELNVSDATMPRTDAAEKLVWFFQQIQRYGSPLIVWTNAAPRHLAFLKTIEPASTLTILLIYGPQPESTIIDLVGENRLKEAQAKCARLPDLIADLTPSAQDALFSAAYFAFARSEDADQAVSYMRRVSNQAEMLLLIANYISRRGTIPNPRPDWMLNHPDGKLTNLQQQHCQEDCFRRVISDPGTEAPLRESGRAKHELGYLLQSLGKFSVAEMLYSQALADLEKCPQDQHDYRWHGTLASLLRDWADLLANDPERLDKSSELLRRAMAIHSFHGRRLQIAYALATAARIALTGRRFTEAIGNAVDSANLFELLQNWRGWGEATKTLFDCFAETRETARMISVAELAMDKLQNSNLPNAQRDRLRLVFTFEKANAYWIAGKLAEARLELVKLGMGPPTEEKVELDPEFEKQVRRLWYFLAIHAEG
jgi:tetratricopeptide (TPR) repeat protein